ncbi:MAG: metallophosphoesterase [Candidatus Alcyoniella australis]|nr:metallophosphoesterase [Candidatus Alcyoniella australis]
MRRVGLALALAALLCATDVFAAVKFGPYLQSLAPDRVRVCVSCDQEDRFEARLTSPQGEQSIVALDGHDPACADFSGLEPDLTYRYELLLEGKPQETSGSFVADSTEQLSLVIFGDTRSGDNSFDLDHRRVAQAISRSVLPDAIVHTGDFVERGNDPALWANFFQIESQVLADAPLYPSIGRSDQPGVMIRRLFGLLNTNGWYSFDRGPAHFAVLNLWQSRSQDSDQTAADGAQATCLRADLAAARAAGARYLFVVMHQPAFDLEGRSPRAMREVYMPLFQSFGVDAVFSGAHYFSHALREGVHYFTNGGGGAQLVTENPAEGLFLFHGAMHHFLALQIDRAGARVSAMDADGDPFYEVQIQGTAQRAQEPGASNYVETFGSGARSAALTVFFEPGCDDCQELQSRLPQIAQRLDATLVATFRSLDDPDNLALLRSHSDGQAAAPAVLVDDQTLLGLEQIDMLLDEQLARSLERGGARESRSSGRLVAAAAATTGAFALLAAIILSRRKRSAR